MTSKIHNKLKGKLYFFTRRVKGFIQYVNLKGEGRTDPSVVAGLDFIQEEKREKRPLVK